jgi:RNA polymerase sigma-70 factor (ECF subfamily)
LSAIADSGTEAVWRGFSDGLRGYIRRRVAPPADAEEILQNVFLRIHANLEHLPDEQRIAGWIYRITSRAITAFYRARAKSEAGVEEMKPASRVEADSPPPAAAGAEQRRDRSIGQCVGAMVDQLPEEHRAAVQLTELDGLTPKDAAEQAGISVPDMESRVQRGRARLKDALLGCCTVELDRRQAVVALEAGDDCR